MKNWTKLLLAMGLIGGLSSAATAQDAAKGENVFKRCQACHMVGDNAKNRVGPLLNNVVGRTAGTIEGFKYSNLNKAAGEAGLVWTVENITAYLPDPNGFLKKYLTDAGKPELAKGSTRMSFRLRKDDEVADVIAYLQQFSPEAEAGEGAEGAETTTTN